MSHDDFNFEPVKGLPEKLPQGEHIIWQGAPDAWALAKESLGLRWVAGYFVVLAIWRATVSAADFPLPIALLHAIPFLVIGLVACGLIYGYSWVQARATVYTLTNKRVGMRIGAALTMTLNIPYQWIGNADLDPRKGGTGTIAFELIGPTKLSYLMSWPHIRPWFIARPQPALRCIPDARKVAEIFAEAAETRLSQTSGRRGAQTDTQPGGMAVAAE